MVRTSLVVSRCDGEDIWIGRTRVQLFELERGRVRLRITADNVVTIVRGELFANSEEVDPDEFGPYYVQQEVLLADGAIRWLTAMEPFKELVQAGQHAELLNARTGERYRVVNEFGRQCGPTVE